MAKSSDTERAIQVAVYGMDGRSESTLQLVFDGPAEGAYAITCGVPEIAIIDMDGLAAQQEWKRLRQGYPHLPSIVLSVKPLDLPGTVYVPKPIAIQQLLGTLKKMTRSAGESAASNLDTAEEPTQVITGGPVRIRQIRTHGSVFNDKDIEECCGQHEDIDPRDSAQRAAITYNPKDYFYGVIESAVRQSRDNDCAVLIEEMLQPIIILPDHHVWISVSDRVLRPFCVVPTSDRPYHIKHLRSTDLVSMANRHRGEFHQLSLESFLWKIAIWTARGRLPVDTDLNQTFYLRHWPNMTRLMLTPHAMQIASLWIRRPCRLINLAERLQIPQRYVFTFYSGAQAIGLAGIERRSSDRTPASLKIDKNDRRGLFSRLLKKLRVAGKSA